MVICLDHEPLGYSVTMPDGSVEVVLVFDCVRVYRHGSLDFWVEVGDGSDGRVRKCDVHTILTENADIVPADLVDKLKAWADFDFREFLAGP